jgi:hypothetical protein
MRKTNTQTRGNKMTNEIKKLQEEMAASEKNRLKIIKNNTVISDFPEIKRTYTYRKNVSPMAVSYV